MVRENAIIDKFPTEHIGNDDNNALHRISGGWLGHVHVEAVKLCNLAYRLAAVNMPREAIGLRHGGRVGSIGPRLCNRK